jgi:hypothetical protein
VELNRDLGHNLIVRGDYLSQVASIREMDDLVFEQTSYIALDGLHQMSFDKSGNSIEGRLITEVVGLDFLFASVELVRLIRPTFATADPLMAASNRARLPSQLLARPCKGFLVLSLKNIFRWRFVSRSSSDSHHIRKAREVSEALTKAISYSW